MQIKNFSTSITFALGAAVLLASNVAAHGRLVTPPTRIAPGDENQGFTKTRGPTTQDPCQGVPFQGVKTQFSPGQTFTYSWEIGAAHRGTCKMQLSTDQGATFQTIKEDPHCADSDGTFNDQATLPSGVTCEQCVLQWRWEAELTKELYLNCADVSIGGGGGGGGNTGNSTGSPSGDSGSTGTGSGDGSTGTGSGDGSTGTGSGDGSTGTGSGDGSTGTGSTDGGNGTTSTGTGSTDGGNGTTSTGGDSGSPDTGSTGGDSGSPDTGSTGGDSGSGYGTGSTGGDSGSTGGDSGSAPPKQDPTGNGGDEVPPEVPTVDPNGDTNTGVQIPGGDPNTAGGDPDCPPKTSGKPSGMQRRFSPRSGPLRMRRGV